MRAVGSASCVLHYWTSLLFSESNNPSKPFFGIKNLVRDMASAPRFRGLHYSSLRAHKMITKFRKQGVKQDTNGHQML